MTHKNIKRFQINVEFLDESDIIRIKAQYESLLSQQMRSSGYIRVLDIDPAFSLEFTGETWKCLMTLHGIYVGKKKSCLYDGVAQGKLIPRSMPQVMLKK